MTPRLEVWLFGFIAGLVVAIVLGMGASRLRQHESADPEGRRGPNQMQLRPNGKSSALRFAFAADAVAS